MNNYYKLLIALTTSLFLISACGQKGPLVLPDNDAEQESEEKKDESS